MVHTIEAHVLTQGFTQDCCSVLICYYSFLCLLYTDTASFHHCNCNSRLTSLQRQGQHCGSTLYAGSAWDMAVCKEMNVECAWKGGACVHMCCYHGTHSGKEGWKRVTMYSGMHWMCVGRQEYLLQNVLTASQRRISCLSLSPTECRRILIRSQASYHQAHIPKA